VHGAKDFASLTLPSSRGSPEATQWLLVSSSGSAQRIFYARVMGAESRQPLRETKNSLYIAPDAEHATFFDSAMPTGIIPRSGCFRF
jgi:hypothetical protein